ncbi:hypothetical protein MNB_SV-6-700 [hydrothermal vent metagenome]|uniref:General secretion pathway protein K n=1 Tax=hydrothermal vent metagenome TaxID=652676 RepID=A0A1W1BUM4_9ZZZZ
MLALVGVIFSYLQKSRDSASYTSALIQADILFRDSKDVIKELLKKSEKDKEIRKTIFDTLYTVPMILQVDDNETYVSLSCHPLDSGVNINWLKAEGNATAEQRKAMAESTIDYIVERYEISDGSLLLSKISDSISRKSDLGKKKGIINLSQLEDIVRDYRFESDDVAKSAIPWDRYFSFGLDSTTIDANYISAELLSWLFDMDISLVEEEWLEGDDLKQFLSRQGGDISRYNEKIFTSESKERMRCRVMFGYAEESYAFGFKYIEGRATEFDFYGKQ